MTTTLAGTTVPSLDAHGLVVKPRVHRAPTPPPPSARVTDVALRFGLDPVPEPLALGRELMLELKPRTITLITGPSGSGKSSLLDAIGALCPAARRVDRVAFPPDRAVIDAVAPEAPLCTALSILTACALSEPRLWLRRFDELSAGEQFRASLARAIGLAFSSDAGVPLLCDEFGGLLHRRAARAIAFNVRKLATRHRLCLVVAASDSDPAVDLQPDVLIRLTCEGAAEISRRSPRKTKPFTLARSLRIEAGHKSDYDQFAAMHYRKRDELGFVDRVFLLRNGIGGEPLAIIVYAHGPIELSLRNVATQKRFLRNPTRLNREVRIIRRIVVHPDVRGCGLGRRLIRETMPRLGVPYVESLATMGELNPIFERAGMKRIGTCPLPAGRVRILEQLRRMHVDAFRPDFATKVSRRPRLRQLVAEAVGDWYRASTGGGKTRVAGQSPRFLAETFRQILGSRPVYYLWCKDEKRHRALRTLASITSDVPEDDAARPRSTVDRQRKADPRRAPVRSGRSKCA